MKGTPIGIEQYEGMMAAIKMSEAAIPLDESVMVDRLDLGFPVYKLFALVGSVALGVRADQEAGEEPRDFKAFKDGKCYEVEVCGDQDYPGGADPVYLDENAGKVYWRPFP